MRKIFVGNFYTFVHAKPYVQAVVVEDNRIIDLGNETDMLSNWRTTNSEVIDLFGKTVIPGFTDSHLHLAPLGTNFIDLDVTGIPSKDALLERIRLETKTVETGEWIVGRGWDENLFTDGGIPTIEELDGVSPHHPLFLSRVCSHASLVNSKALEIANYHPTMSIPEGGTVVLDKATNRPNGLLLESASELIKRHIPDKTDAQWKRALRKAINHALAKGLTSVHTNDPNFIGGLHKTYQLYDELLNDEQLGLRCNLLIDHIFLDDLKESGMYAGYGNETLQIGAVKVFVDGALGRRTALLSEAYTDSANEYGESMLDHDTLYQIVKQARELSMPIAAHTIGDKALEEMLNIMAMFSPAPYRDRLIHLQVLREDLIERLRSPHIIADIQPRFVASDFPWVKNRLGEKRMHTHMLGKRLSRKESFVQEVLMPP